MNIEYYTPLLLQCAEEVAGARREVYHSDAMLVGSQWLACAGSEPAAAMVHEYLRSIYGHDGSKLMQAVEPFDFE